MADERKTPQKGNTLMGLARKVTGIIGRPFGMNLDLEEEVPQHSIVKLPEGGVIDVEIDDDFTELANKVPYEESERIIKEIIIRKKPIHVLPFRDEGDHEASQFAFQPTEILGQGNFGIVTSGYVPGLYTKELVAKFMKPSPDPRLNSSNIALFVRGMKKARSTSSKYVTGHWGAGMAVETGSPVYLSTKVPGKNLEDRFLEWKASARLFHPLITGFIFWQWLNAVHEMTSRCRTAHRDHKGANVKFQEEGLLTILDLGSVIEIDKDGRAPHEFTIGTDLYLHPRAALPRKGETMVNYANADAHALATEGYRLSTGMRPFDRDIVRKFDPEGNPRPEYDETVIYSTEKYLLTKLALMERYQLVSPREINKRIPKILSDAIMRCFVPDLEQIPPVSELRQMVQQCLYCPEYGAGPQDLTIRKYFDTFSPGCSYNPEESSKNDALFRALALANFFDESKQGLGSESIEDNPRFKRRLDYSYRAIDINTPFRETIGRTVTRTLYDAFGLQPSENYAKSWGNDYNRLRDTFLPEVSSKLREKLGREPTEKEAHAYAEGLLVQEFWKHFRQHRPIR
ncbi:MAG: hypothetical protein PHH00_04145 [Candidatus Nanoarchaeia archaeon]|nr:hypothetical protein [Candidatus Nanoarchaeia archaeon]